MSVFADTECVLRALSSISCIPVYFSLVHAVYFEIQLVIASPTIQTVLLHLFPGQSQGLSLTHIREMEKNLLLRSTAAAFLLLFTAGNIVFCGSRQAHKTGSSFQADGGSHVGKGSSASLEVVLLPPSLLSSAAGEDQTASNTRLPVVLETQVWIQKGESRNPSPPDVWPTSAEGAEFVPGRHSRAFSVHSPATTLGDKVRRLQRSAPCTRPTTTIDTPQRSLIFATPGIFLKMMSSLTALFKSPSSNRRGTAPSFSDSPRDRAPLADPNAKSLHFASDGELSKSLVRDISPTEMRPITTTPHDDGVDTFGVLRNQYKHRRALLRDISPPGMWPISSDDDDEFSVHRRRALLSVGHDSTNSSSATATTSGRYQKHRRALLRDISAPGMWPITSDDDEFQVSRRRSLLSDDSAHSSSATATTGGRHQKHRRALLRDISPPGMWPITSDDDEFHYSRRRALLSHNSPKSSSAAATTSDRNQNHRRALLRDISPPGMWPITSDDDEFQVNRRRRLLSDNSAHSSSETASTSDRHPYQKQRRALLLDISPPGMWPITSDDDDEFQITRRRALLSDVSPHSPSATESLIDRHRHHKQRRALLRDISPPGMWPITSDDDEEFSVHRRRALLSDDDDSTHSPSATAATSGRHQKSRRALLRDISPPGMWPITSDDDEFQVRRRRALLSDDLPHSSPATASTSDLHRYQKQRRALRRDISPPGMWPITSDDDEFEAARRRRLLSDASPHSSAIATTTMT